jgi:hypothetical protein
MLVDNYPGTFALVQIPIECAYSTPWGNDRCATFYGVTEHPSVFFDGVEEVVGTFGDLDEQYAQYEAAYLAREAIPTDVTIEVAGSPIAGAQTYSVGTRVCLEAGGTAKTMRIYIGQVLKNWPSSPDWCHHTFKQAAMTEDITLSPGECQTVVREFTFDNDSWAQQNDIQILVWAQEPQDTSPPDDRAEVFQAAIMNWPFPPDCNANGLPDDQDIASGYSPDDNANGVPDECEAPVFAGADLLVTPGLDGQPGPTYRDLAGDPVPPDFFGPGSDPFDGIIYFKGNPLTGTGLPPGTDTIVERLQDAELPDPFGSEDSVDTQIVALNLVSTMPITVTFNGGSESAIYDVQVCLSSISPQPLGQMLIRHQCAEGGTFDSTVPVIPKMTFTKVLGVPGAAEAILDPAPQLDFTVTNGCWSHADPGFGIYTSPGGMVDHDCDGVDDVPYLATSNFFGGVCWIGCDTSLPDEARKRLTVWQAPLAAQGVLPPEEGQADDLDGDGIHDLADNCPDAYNPLQEDTDADTVGDECDNCPENYNPFQEDIDSNGIGDVCDRCLGDLDENGVRNLSDLAQLLGHYGQTGMTYDEGDIDEDGDVDLSDLAWMIAVYGLPCPSQD